MKDLGIGKDTEKKLENILVWAYLYDIIKNNAKNIMVYEEVFRKLRIALPEEEK